MYSSPQWIKSGTHPLRLLGGMFFFGQSSTTTANLLLYTVFFDVCVFSLVWCLLEDFHSSRWCPSSFHDSTIQSHGIRMESGSIIESNHGSWRSVLLLSMASTSLDHWINIQHGSLSVHDHAASHGWNVMPRFGASAISGLQGVDLSGAFNSSLWTYWTSYTVHGWPPPGKNKYGPT